MGERCRERKDTSKYTLMVVILWVLIDTTDRYFGRAKDLPGVKELFQSKKKEEDEENAIYSHYKKFIAQGPSYFGDLAETDGSLLEYEHEAEEAGTLWLSCGFYSP